MAKRHERTHARRCALQVLYTSEIQGAYPSVVASSERFLSEDGDLPDYAQKLIQGVEAHQIEIDRMLTSTSENWALARMPIVDRSILRLATFEMAYMDDVPVSVTINEAVELAKDFGGADDSPRFVNGVLGRIVRDRFKGGGLCARRRGKNLHDRRSRHTVRHLRRIPVRYNIRCCRNVLANFGCRRKNAISPCIR